jgi:hypothetical protein
MVAISLAALPCFATGAEIGSATRAQKAAAGAAYKRGLVLFNGQKNEAALQQFRDSYAQVKSPNPHLMIGRTLVELHRYREAHAELEATLAEAEAVKKTDAKYARTVQAAQTEIDALLQKAARIEIEVSEPDGSVRLDGEPLTREELGRPVIVEPGNRTVVFTSSAGQRVEKSVTAAAGALVHVSLEPPPEVQPAVAPAPRASAPSPDHRRAIAYVLGGVGAASIATFAVLATKANADAAALKNACTAQSCPANLRDRATTGKQRQTGANAALFVGVFALGTGAVLLWQSMDDSASSERGVSMRLGAGAVQMDGTF